MPPGYKPRTRLDGFRNLSGIERISMNDLYASMAKLVGSKLAARHAPPRAGDVLHSLASIERARELLGYSPKVPWRQGLATTLEWYRSRHAVAQRA